MSRTVEAAEAETSPALLYADAAAAEAFGHRLLVAHDLPEQDAARVAHCLVRADLRGHDTHGLQTLPHYLNRLRRKLINPRPQLTVKRVTPMVGSLDGQDAFGFVVATKGMDEAMAMAREFGVGIVSAYRSTHFGMAANYSLQAMDAGFIGIVFTNASRAMPPWGGRKALLGTSPIAVAAPGGLELPFDLDMSPAVAARGKIRRAARRGENIPLGYALDAQGRQTADPDAALAGGTVQPIGGPKGSGLAMLMDIMSGVVSGSACAGDVRNHFEDYEAPQNVGHFIMAMKPDLFVGREEYEKRMDRLVQRVHANPAAEGFHEVIMPGERERRLEAKHRRSGVPFHSKEVTAMQAEADRAGVPRLVVSNVPLA
jgi:LDH2 family malate/lactate/ureidoglycolate dehydrogenase